VISERHAVVQIARLSACSGGKNVGKAEAAEYLRVTKAAAKTDHQVAAAVTAWIDSQTFAPSPAELRVMIEATPTHSAKPAGDCLDCHGGGRRSYWALVTVERWEDSGRIRRRKVEEIPVTGDPNLWLVSTPALAATVDGNKQRVVMMSGYCHCDSGKRLAQMVQAREAV
jgi:hypothetical protein